MSDFMQKMVTNVTFKYPRVDQWYQYNNATKKSDPCERTAIGAKKSIGFTMQPAAAKAFYKECKEHFERVAANNDNLGEFKGIHGYVKNDDGTVTFNAKRNGMTRAGKPGGDVKVVDGNRIPMDNAAFWGGSRGNLKFSILPTINPQTNESGVSLFLDAVQVTHAVYGDGGDVDDFPLVDDGNSDFPVVNGSGSSAAQKAAKALDDDLAKTMQSIADDFNDDITF